MGPIFSVRAFILKIFVRWLVSQATKDRNVKIRGGNPSNFWIGCGFSTDFGILADCRFGLLILAIFLYVSLTIFKNEVFYI